jgi:hypothetical protein
MRLLTATTETQGEHPGDFDYCTPGEFVMMPTVICDRDIHADDPGTGGCGCGRSFTGLASHRGTTTAEVRDLDTSSDEYTAAIINSLEQQGWPVDGAARTAQQLIEIAADYPTGTVLGHRLGAMYLRRQVRHP